jgi:hypothetical protein|tara:strand:- start:2122 stop:2523 length:402 start_codon:yes stop_codon:yes gene_type:complete
MANAIYPLAKASFLKGELDMVDDTIKVVLVDTGTYTYNAAHDFYNDLSGILGTGVELGSRTVTLGVFDAADVTFTTPSAGTTIEALVIYKDTGNVATSNLIAYIDTGTGLAFTTNGADIDIVWDSGANKIFSI